ncbi:MAG: hypothetical protein KDK70_30115 [Myxococcales bacterium]|nr:hypothetical protein [Myxococcales bacterium]
MATLRDRLLPCAVLTAALLPLHTASAAPDFEQEDDDVVVLDDEVLDDEVLEDDEVDPAAYAQVEDAAPAEGTPDEGELVEGTLAEGTPTDGEALDPQAAGEGEDEAGEVDPAAYAAFLREQVAAKREQVSEAISNRVLDKQIARMDLVSTIFSVVSALGLLLLLMPLWLRKRYPGRQAVLWKYSALCTLIFIVTINLFAGVFGVLRVAQVAAGQATNPQVQIVEATFDVIDENAEDLAELGPVLIEPTLAGLDGSAEDPLPVLLLQNVQALRKDLTVFESVAGLFRSMSGVFGYLPLVLSLTTVAVFLLGLRQTLVDIVRLPVVAAAGEQGAARRVVGATLRRVGREILATLAVVVVLVVVLVLAGAFMAAAIGPAIEAFIGYLGASFIYLQVVPEASTGYVLASLVGAVIFLVLDLALVIVASALFVGKAHKILQRRLHDREPLCAHRRFWGWGTVSLLWALAFPLLFVTAAQPLVEWLIDVLTRQAEVSWGLLLVSGPAVLVLGFVLMLWATRGLRAVTFLAKVRVPKLGSPVAAGATGMMTGGGAGAGAAGAEVVVVLTTTTEPSLGAATSVVVVAGAGAAAGCAADAVVAPRHTARAPVAASRRERGAKDGRRWRIGTLLRLRAQAQALPGLCPPARERSRGGRFAKKLTQGEPRRPFAPDWRSGR